MSLRVLPPKDVAISVTFPVILRESLHLVILRERSDRRISAGVWGFFATLRMTVGVDGSIRSRGETCSREALASLTSTLKGRGYMYESKMA